jgi:hypothetical protein
MRSLTSFPLTIASAYGVVARGRLTNRRVLSHINEHMLLVPTIVSTPPRFVRCHIRERSYHDSGSPPTVPEQDKLLVSGPR